ncbi:hypothetical protein ScPMuIL_013199 [Solemya velum]
MGGTTSAEPDSTPASAQTDQFLACSDSNSDPENMSSPEDNESDCSKHDRSKDQIPENMSQNPKQDEWCPEERKPLPTSPAVEVGSLSDGDVADTSPNLTGNSIQVLEDCYMGNDHCVSKPRESGLLSPPEYPCHAKCDVLLLDTLPIQTHQTSRPRNCDVKQSLSSSKLSTKFTNKDKASHVQNRLDDPLKIIAEYTAVEATYGKDESSGSVESSEKNTAGKIIRGEDSSWDLTNSYRRSRRAIDSGDVSHDVYIFQGGTTSAEPDSTPASAQTDQFLACSDSNSDPENMSSPEDNESDCSKHDRSKDQIPENMSQNPKQDEWCPEERKPLPTSPAVEVDPYPMEMLPTRLPT